MSNINLKHGFYRIWHPASMSYLIYNWFRADQSCHMQLLSLQCICQTTYVMEGPNRPIGCLMFAQFFRTPFVTNYVQSQHLSILSSSNYFESKNKSKNTCKYWLSDWEAHFHCAPKLNISLLKNHVKLFHLLRQCPFDLLEGRSIYSL